MNKKPGHISLPDWQLLLEKYGNEQTVLKALENHYPVQYLIGNVEFCDCVIEVNENCLIPRFETEELVLKTIERLTKKQLKSIRVLEVGTGSGCISIALKKHLPCEITTLDINENALKVAEKNAKSNGVQIEFLNIDVNHWNDWDFDLIISNPPYVDEKESVGEETKYEPQNALFAPCEGLYFYELMIKKISESKKKPHLIAFEIGMNQANKIKEFQRNYLPEFQFTVEKDLSGKDRFVFIEQK